ncbi:MAG: flagellar biosynthesis protein FlgB [Actinobacteria bacterium]|jgi:flagellar basal-body rod protein FlgB|nr:flagellar biosynthesis protein FlgB [Actinomycetota bacterium]
MWDVTTTAALRALDGLALRGTVRANNVANAETPGYRAQTVDFESSLRTALRRGEPATATAQTVATPSVVDARGNSVDLETELIQGMKDSLQRDAMITAFNYKTGQLRVAIGGRR